MPTPFTSTFASAAASTNGENSANRSNNNAGNEWSRSRVNGATQTFRRPSVATTPSSSNLQGQSQLRDMPPTPSATHGGVYIPPHLNANHPSNSPRSMPSGDIRYSKDQLLSIYQTLKDSASLDRSLDDLFLGSWDPLDGKLSNASQTGRGDLKDQIPGPEVCWNYSTEANPLGMADLTEDEKQLFSSSVNSPIKLQQTTTKEGTGAGTITGRKASLSGYSSTAPGSRPGTRRRETSDSYTSNGPLSPVESKTFFRGDSNTATPPPALLRRRTDYKDEEPTPPSKDDPDGDDPADSQLQFPGPRRSATGPLSAGLHPPSGSPWSAGTQAGGFGSMGSFGSFAIGSATTPTEPTDKRPGFGSARGGSRFKDLLSKTSSEDIGQGLKDKASFGALEKLPEEDAEAAHLRSQQGLSTRPGRSETNPYAEIPGRSGSAALGGSQEDVPATQGIEQMGFSAYGPPQPNIGTRDFGTDDPYQQTPHGRFNPHEPMSPTNTNPYQSPHGRLEDDEQDTNDSASQASGLPPFGGSRRNVFPNPDDRGPGAGLRGPGGFGGLGFGNLGGPSWSGAGIGSGKPALDRGIGTGFGDPIFSPLADLQSPGAGGLGGGFFASGGFGSAGRASRLGAMFPPAMQEQMRGDSRNDLPTGSFDPRPDSAQHVNRDPFDNAGRRLEGFGRGSSAFEESPPVRTVEEAGSIGPPGGFGPSGTGPQTGALPTPQPAGIRPPPGTEGFQSTHGLSQSSGSSGSNQMPAAQQRQMVMPDRMRWIYRDPQGNTQGPWSGLEMHDWFKAGFFTAELQVKKLEDVEYEPLAQLVRRIGNSREPFLVPQIGVPHGPPSAVQGNHWATSMAGTGGPAQPPFASSFPSFGTTLTAEQQNALERRKQEEQFLMARQKEHLAQQQMAMKHMQIQNGLHSLQHHSSAHSLQSQPSFGSITSPTGYQPSPMQGPIQPPQQQSQSQPPQSGQSFGPPGGPNPGQTFGAGREDDVQNMMDRLSFSQRANLPYSSGPLGPPSTEAAPTSQQVSSMLQDRARLQQQQSEIQNHQDTFLGQQGRNDRLEEFHTLRGEVDNQAGRLGPDESLPQPIGSQRHSEEQSIPTASSKVPVSMSHLPFKGDYESLSLAQQVQIAAASQQAAAEESAWARIDTPIDPPPVSISPLPAPAAQRNRQHVADALAADSRSATQTPIETPSASIAPWAERTVEHPKGPSLKEIQEAETKRAAEQEELAAAARRAQADQERLVQAQAPVAAPGLPLTSTWAASSSPVGAQSSVWGAKPAPTKPGPVSGSNSKKTLAQIQKEEESRKQRAAVAAAASASIQNAASPTSAAVGKRYAELASKAAPAVPNPLGGAWLTVGSNGKSKAPPPPPVVASPQPATRTVSSTITSTAAKVARPTLSTSRSSILPNQSKANEEFTKWIRGSLGKGLNSSINVDSFVQDLMVLPPDVEIISDSIYASSQTLDGRRFAEEFVRRRKLADKGIIEPAANGAHGLGADNKGGAGGWSEVAKKGPAPKEESTSVFKVVATKKKGKR